MPARAAGRRQGVNRAVLDPRIDRDGLGRGAGQRVAVRLGGGDGAQAEAAVGAGLVVDDDLLAEDRCHQTSAPSLDIAAINSGSQHLSVMIAPFQVACDVL